MERHDTLLVACGTAENRKLLCANLEEYYNLLEAANEQQMLLLLEQNGDCIATVLLDVTDFDLEAQEVLIQPEIAKLFEGKPVIAVAEDVSSELCSSAFRHGAVDVIPLHYDPYAMRRRIANIVELSVHKNNLEALVHEQAEALRHSQDVIVDALSSIIEYRSVESGQHILRIRHFTKILLEKLVRACPEYGLTETDVRLISSAAALHDVGKISIPDAILKKPGRLTDEEMEIMKGHALTGCHVLQRLGDLGDREYMRYAHNICHYHHERWDGKGYPEGLSGEQIPICAQVVGLADVYDALTNKRVYKEAYSFDTAVNMILNGECGAFSPKLLECFKQVAGQYEDLARAYADGLSPRTENFDTTLSAAEPTQQDSIEQTWAKFQALIHYSNVFLLELDLRLGTFHLLYNPYPELFSLRDINTIDDLRRMMLHQVVVPEEKQEMEQLFSTGVKTFLQQGLRRVNHHFTLRSKEYPQGEPFEVTLLQINPSDKENQTIAVLGRKLTADAQQPRPETAAVQFDAEVFGDSSYCCRFDKDYTLIRLGGSTQRLAGYDADQLQEIFDNKLLRMIPEEDRDTVHSELHRQLGSGAVAKFAHRVLHKSGKMLWVLNKSRLVVSDDGAEYLYSVLSDISDTKQTEIELNNKLNQYEIILAQTENALFDWDVRADRIEFSNTWNQVFGFAQSFGNAYRTLRAGVYFHPDDLPVLLEKIDNIYRGSSYEMVEVRMTTAKGRYLWCRFRASAIRDEAGALVRIVGVVINIDAEKQAERALQQRADRDALTNLLNKSAGSKQAEEYLTQEAGGADCALLIVDLDDFKLVNDRYGHLFGDEVLALAAKEIKNLFRNQDIIARIGGDEFMVLMRGVSNRALIETRCKQMLSVLRESFRQYEDFPLGCSIGVALAPEHGTGYNELFRCADQALYLAKRRGKNSYLFYDKNETAYSLQQTTAVSKRIDSDEQPGLADSGIVRYEFQKLYAATDVAAAIQDALAAVGRQLNVSRVYIFENSHDNRTCSNTYEWCNEGITPEIENLQNISYQEDIPGYRECFNSQDILYCSDIAQLPKPVYDILAPQGIKSMLHCAIRENGQFRGYIGFDECSRHHLWTKEQIQILTYFSEMLSVFLLNQRKRQQAERQLEELKGLLDSHNGWVYSIDPENYELSYLNQRAQAMTGITEPQAGQRCYQAFYQAAAPCKGCPAAQIRETKTAAAYLMQNTVLAEASLVRWGEQDRCLVTCRKLPKIER